MSRIGITPPQPILSPPRLFVWFLYVNIFIFIISSRKRVRGFWVLNLKMFMLVIFINRMKSNY